MRRQATEKVEQKPIAAINCLVKKGAAKQRHGCTFYPNAFRFLPKQGQGLLQESEL